MAREELISSAVTFLQDPAVASSPVEKKVAFLQSKNLTKEEVDIALSRAGEDPSAVAAVTASSSSTGYQSPPPQSAYRPPPPPPQGYGYPPYGQWQPPPEPPKRDWRDWFIMATVMGGVGYGMYTVAKRYITPLIAPPTPPQLEQDKENIDEQFSRAFALIEQVSTDTAALKSAEETRTERLDTALREVENLVADLKTSSRRRDDETRRISDEVKSLKDAIPKAMEGAREGNENRLKELGTEVKSLKVLLGNRLGGAGSSSPVTGKSVGTSLPSASRPPEESTPTTPAAAAAPATANGASAIPVAQESQHSTGAAPAASTPTTPSAGGNPLSQFNRSASIPAWQMAAANRSKTASPATPATPATNAGDSSSSATGEQQSAPAS
ncbi:putative peroxisomal membrane anchor protein (Pex14) [Aspergillus melleus]|uniref:putative peroxisomal membrane anchor protein (Pex14) n=1 Tax=Aspergillus melleus TaxID=138277 RepID=UPI001E8D2438|nr:peroxisomal membrane protein pex14 [Aspergillus melleus]KAH8423881.1 peroxisomal membrane protein pex14 [Aspergillus melleus]